MDYQYRENGTRNIYSNCKSDEIKKINQKNYTLSTFPSSNRRNYEDSGTVLAFSVSQFYQSTAVQL